ncbi:MAG: signal peptidase I [Actinobacteria bacterium]|nr:MAG: signal peptidase I [Actinomycetota bacterium]
MAARAEPPTDGDVSDPYEVLGVSTSASPQEIEAAYRRAALEGRYQDGSWVELRDAYDVLRDPEQRARHDLGLDGDGAAEAQKRSRNPVDRLFPNLPHGWRVALDWMVTIVGAVAIVLAIKAWVVNPYRIPSSSMEPTLHCAVPAQGCEARTSDRVLACRFCYHLRSPHRGDIVVFNTPSLAKQECGSQGTFVKRLIGLPGEVWEEREGLVYINGQKLDEPYIKPDRKDARTMGLADIPPRNTYTRIPKNMYLMMGDNRKSSCDSRVWGLVPRKNLIGNVFATYWPPSRISFH